MNDVLSALISVDIAAADLHQDIEVALDEPIAVFRKDFRELMETFHPDIILDFMAMELNGRHLSEADDEKTFRDFQAWDGSRITFTANPAETNNNHSSINHGLSRLKL